MTPAIPRIQSVGAPPEAHADRVVAEMLRHIVANQTVRWDDVARIFRSAQTGGDDGNPAAQQRLVEKLKAAGGDFFFGVFLEPGKRGKYTITFFQVCGLDPNTDKPISHVDEIPDKPQLLCSMGLFESKGRGVYNVDGMPHLIVTHHALSRLAQRCDARVPKDMINAVACIWKRLIEVQSDCLEYSGRANRLPEDHRMRVNLGEAMGDCYAVLRRHSEEDSVTVVTTILGPDGL